MSSQDPSMSEMLWRRGIEQVVLTSGAKERVLGLFGLRGGTGVSQVALRVARTLASANRKTLETFLRHHHSQGLSSRLVKPEELFHPGTLESFKL